jgi:predicted ATPase
LFRRLGVFLGGFDLEAAQAVGVGAAVQHTRCSTCSPARDKSLVVAENVGGRTRRRWSAAPVRWKGSASQERPTIRGRHATTTRPRRQSRRDDRAQQQVDRSIPTSICGRIRLEPRTRRRRGHRRLSRAVRAWAIADRQAHR